jgi:hypothetical protein
MPYPLCFRERRVHELAWPDTRIASRLHSLPASLLRQPVGGRMLDLRNTGPQTGINYRSSGR